MVCVCIWGHWGRSLPGSLPVSVALSRSTQSQWDGSAIYLVTWAMRDTVSSVDGQEINLHKWPEQGLKPRLLTWQVNALPARQLRHFWDTSWGTVNSFKFCMVDLFANLLKVTFSCGFDLVNLKRWWPLSSGVSQLHSSLPWTHAHYLGLRLTVNNNSHITSHSRCWQSVAVGSMSIGKESSQSNTEGLLVWLKARKDSDWILLLSSFCTFFYQPVLIDSAQIVTTLKSDVVWLM